jgi:hypothetical protein
MSRKCNSIGCKRKAQHGGLCYTCKSRRFRNKNPLEASYLNLKGNAKRRGIYFAVTLEYYKYFCEVNNYLTLRVTEDMTIDRIEPELGYIDGNLQMLKRAVNSAKRYEDEKRIRELLWAEKFKMVEIVIEEVATEVPEDPPF